MKKNNFISILEKTNIHRKCSRLMILFAAILIESISSPAVAHDFEIDGICYTIIDRETNQVEVSSLTSAFENEILNIPAYINADNTVFSVTKLGWDSCKHAKAKTVNLPNTLIDTGDFSFYECENLEEVNFGNNVTKIGYDCFAICSNLKRVILPNSVTIIDDGAFNWCTGIEEIRLGSNINEIRYLAFYKCTNVKSFECYAEEPPYGGPQCFDFMPSDLTLSVPSESIEKYRGTNPWNKFNNVFPLSDDNPDIVFNTYSIQLPLHQETTILVLSSQSSLTWNSSNESVATVENGHVTGLGTGSCIITATDTNGNTATCNVYVIIPATTLEIPIDKLTIEKGSYAEITPVVYPEDASYRYVWWDNPAPYIATVESYLLGPVKIIGENIGKTVLTARTHNNIEKNIEVEVIAPKVSLEIFCSEWGCICLEINKDESQIMTISPIDGLGIKSILLNGIDIMDRLAGNNLNLPGLEEDSKLHIVLENTTTVSTLPAQSPEIIIQNQMVTMRNLIPQKDIHIYDLDGKLINHFIPVSDKISFELPHGLYLISTENFRYKIAL
ncbi:MAG: leucine-rich repeat protein [Muribaculaceae bacterium]|nr:leucine-rich repeat protein [Muribaculaceae bacterium]